MDVILECMVIGILEFSISWVKDGISVVNEKWYKLFFDGELVILKVIIIELEDEGEYKCVVENMFGLFFCLCEFFVNEVNVKFEFKEKMKFVNVMEGEEVKFLVYVIGNFLFVIDWFCGKE